MWGPVRASNIGATRADIYVGSAAYWAAFSSVNPLIARSGLTHAIVGRRIPCHCRDLGSCV
jgi:hypothetical protein